jgi:hypothetical protein
VKVLICIVEAILISSIMIHIGIDDLMTNGLISFSPLNILLIAINNSLFFMRKLFLKLYIVEHRNYHDHFKETANWCLLISLMLIGNLLVKGLSTFIY